MVMLTLEPSAHDIESELVPLDERLQQCEENLRGRRQWHPPAISPRSPEYSIIDISDLSSAIALLEDLVKHSGPSKKLTPQPSFSQYTWTWDPLWKEFYAHLPDQSALIYLSRWRLNEARQIWEHVNVASADVMPDSATQLLGAWEDWQWDPMWKEWYLDVSKETDSGEEEKSHVYASKWEVGGNGDWTYVGRIGNVVA
jgi:hypothetical protein